MKRYFKIFAFISPIFLLVLPAVLLTESWTTQKVSAQKSSTAIDEGGGGDIEVDRIDEITDQQRNEIQLSIKRNIEKLRREGKLRNADAIPPPITLSSPIAKAPGVEDFNIEAIPFYVDHNPAFPNQLSDWNCGIRTYDDATGNNHRGTDIRTHPFGWKKVENNEAYVVAAAPGTIVYKNDGNFDRNCTNTTNNGMWNAVYVLHPDNSIAWYGHLKKESLTTKQIGETVETGEYLGVIGSSGNSSVPHLHLELYNAAGELQDPYQGACNLMNNFSWWANQEPYRNSRINALTTGSAPPVFPTCPQPEITNEKRVFRPGDALTTTAYIRDIQIGQRIDFSILQPDESVFQSWFYISPNTPVPATYRFANWQIPADAPRGVWTYKVLFNGKTYERTFLVGTVSFDFDGNGKSDIAVFRPSDTFWYFQRPNTGFSATQFGLPTDKIVPADYDGDGRADIAVYRDGIWYRLNSTDNSFNAVQFGLAEDIPQPADFDGDGRSELALYRPSNGVWYFWNLTNNQFSAIQFGISTDRPIAGDFDGDGKTDIAVLRTNGVDPAQWWINGSTAGVSVINFGLPTDRAVPADYDGDGKTDPAVYRDGTWQILQSTGELSEFQFGISTDVPVPADYDGDGLTDAAVFRDGVWWLQQTTNGIAVQQFGLNGDSPVPTAFIH